MICIFWESACGKQTRWIILTVRRKGLTSVTCGMRCLIISETEIVFASLTVIF